MKNKSLCQLYETSVRLLKVIDKLSMEEDMLDEQDYLDWKDSLNELSVDPDRN
jgi:hypothetical protein